MVYKHIFMPIAWPVGMELEYGLRGTAKPSSFGPNPVFVLKTSLNMHKLLI